MGAENAAAIEKIEQLVKGGLVIEGKDGKQYVSRDFHALVDEPRQGWLEVETLTSIVEYLTSNVDKININEVLINVDGVDQVSVMSKVQETRKQRDSYLTCKLDGGFRRMDFERFMPVEEFIIKLRSLFVNNEDNDKVVQFVSKVTQADEREATDDGVSQKVKIKMGISGSLNDNAVAPTIVSLSPYRTFREVAQPVSKFLLRLKGNDDGVFCALFEADGGAWRNEAKANIKKYLKENCPKDVTILS